MPPRLFHRSLFACVLAFAAAAPGCGSPPDGTFAVVLREPRELSCFPTILTADADPVSLVQLASSIPASWRDAYDAGQFPAQGGELHVVAQSDRSLAWFGGFQVYPYVLWNGVVFEGDPHEGFVEVNRTVPHFDSFESEHSGALCEPQPESESELLATVDQGEIEGRIHRTEYYYLPPLASPCAGHVACSRSLSLEGGEER